MLFVIDDQNRRLHSFLTKWPSFKKTTIRGRRGSWRGELREPHPEPGWRSGVAELRPPLAEVPLEHIEIPCVRPVFDTRVLGKACRHDCKGFAFLFGRLRAAQL